MTTENNNIILQVEGTPRATPPQLPADLAGLVRGTPRLQSFDMLPPSRAAATGEVHEVTLLSDDVMELEMEGGYHLWMTVEEYRRDFAPDEQRGGGPLRIGATLPVKGRERGLLKWIIKSLKLIGIDLADGAAAKLADKIDTKKGLNGLYTLPLAADKLTLNADPHFPGGSEPLLVFIHGTMSSTEGSFSGLWSDQGEVRRRLAGRYGERVYAFEHKTFTESPIDNALDLVTALPTGATLHLVSHSRGGMVGELLCRAGRCEADPFDEGDLRLFPDPVMAGKLRRLSALLTEKQLRIERFVRVACPARGTTLASRRLDRCISLLFSGLSALDKSGWVGDITWFAASVIKERTDPKTMPGIEAMMPDSATVMLLNRAGVTVDADLRVIAGDYDGGGILGRFGDWATEGFFGSEADVVVNTPSMYGGAKRKDDGGWYVYVHGPQVWHFSYFKQAPSAARLADGLLLASAADAGFAPLATAPDKDQEIARGIVFDLAKEKRGAKLTQVEPSATGNKPLAVVVPGIMGTHLQVDGQRIWLDLDAACEGKFPRIGMDRSGVETDGAVRMSYAAFVESLAATHEVLIFPYDWRLSLRDEGVRFATYLATVIAAAEGNGRPVRIVAHSMGGLLTRMAAVLTKDEGGNDWWARLKQLRGSRLVMAGTPNGGSWVVPAVLTGRDGVIKMLKMLDLSHSRNDLLRIIGRFEGFLEMLPVDSACFDQITWKSWQVDDEDWPLLDPALLAKCAANRSLLDRFDFHADARFICYLAGHDDHTPQTVMVAGKKLRFLSSSQGDGRVLWETGIPRAKGLEVWYLPAVHGDLLNHAKSFDGMREVIDTGSTTLLAKDQPTARSAEGEFLPEVVIPYYPDAALLYRGVLGMSLHKREADERGAVISPFRVSVCHGDLSAARHPVAVGHYLGDTINGAEAALDMRLKGALQCRHRLGIYPGDVDTSDIFFMDGSQWGAIVIGLGQVGELTGAQLTRFFAHTLLRYATMRPQGKKQSSAENSFKVSATLIGSGQGWGLGIKDSVRALIDGAAQANELLVAVVGARIAELELLELYEDRAIQALQAVRELVALGFAGPVEVEPTLHGGEGGRCRATCETPDGWWQRVRIEEEEDGALKFSTITGLARIEERVQLTQRGLVDRLIDNAISTLDISEKEMVAIYNLVTPNSLKARAADEGDLLLLLDPKAAGYPWELMHVGDRQKRKPLALRAGLIRQLALKEYRERPTYSREQRALVVADPALPTNKHFSRLLGALKEGETVRAVLQSGQFQVQSCLGAGSREIMASLFDQEYRILHLAGHGVYLWPSERRLESCETVTSYSTGMVIDCTDKGEPVLLTRVEVEQMVRVPELVFINCCHLGLHPVTREKTNLKDRNLFAGELATAFIKMGVRAVIAAGWAVDDRAAELFAATFYGEMFEGSSFGDAVRVARNAAANAPTGGNTWAAYQCYGDPGYRLRESENHESSKCYLSPSEALCDIRALSVQIRDERSGAPADTKQLLRELTSLSSAIPHDWFKNNGALREALGAAYAAHGDFVHAIEHYEAAARCNDGQCSLRAMEQLFNMRVRWAGKSGGSPANMALIEEATASFEILVGLVGENKERCCLLGSGYKRLSSMKMDLKMDPLADGTLQKMIDWYRKPMEADPSDPYPALNWAMGMAVLYVAGKSVDMEYLIEIVEQAGENGKKMNERNPNFWSGIHAIDADFFLLIVANLCNAQTKKMIGEITDRYKAQCALSGNSNNIDSVLSQFDFYLKFVKNSDIARMLKQVKKELSANK